MYLTMVRLNEWGQLQLLRHTPVSLGILLRFHSVMNIHENVKGVSNISIQLREWRSADGGIVYVT